MKLSRTVGLAVAVSLPRFLPHPPVGLRHDGNNRNASQRPAQFAWPTHPQAAIRGATSFSCPRSSFAGKPRGTGGLVPVVGQRPARVLRQSRRARSFLGNIRAILGYAAKVNAFAPAWMIPFLGTAATVLELLFGVTLVLDSRCGGRLSAARACSSYSVQPWRSRLGSSRDSTTLYSLRCAAPYFWVSPARMDGP